ncbi:MAG: alanine dehydrogenase [Methanobacterium sp. ERen5]|nr:MAG: alanine dehydrogenase [Methanobacterium sp. ERen5]
MKDATRYETLLLKQSEIKELIEMKEIIESVETAYTVHATRNVQMPAKKYLFFKKYNGDLRIMPAFINNMDEAGVKCVNVHPENPVKYNLPTVMGVIQLFDPKSGFPLSVMDGTWITNMRTGAAAGVGTKYLARKDSKTLGIIGAGKQAFTQLMALKEVMDIEHAHVFCRTCSSRENFADMARERFDIDINAVSTAEEAVKNMDVVVTVTPANKPILKTEWITEGTHINAMGADAPGKQELEVGILQKAKIFIDCWEQARHSGEINVPVHDGIITRKSINSKIGDVIIGKAEGRISDEDITVFDSTGLAVQDMVTGWKVYEEAVKKGVGTVINFLE